MTASLHAFTLVLNNHLFRIKSVDNCRKIKKVGEPIVHHHSGTTKGTWMRDPLGLLGDEKIWYMNGFYGNKVLEFEDMNHFKAGQIGKTYTLPIEKICI